MYDLISSTWNLQVLESFARFLNSQNKCYWCNLLLFTSPTQDINLIKIYWSHVFNIFIVQHSIVNLRAREYCTFPKSGWFCTLKLIQRHYKLSKIEKNRLIGIISLFFLLQYYLSPVNGKIKNSEASIKFRRIHFTK